MRVVVRPRLPLLTSYVAAFTGVHGYEFEGVRVDVANNKQLNQYFSKILQYSPFTTKSEIIKVRCR